MVGSIKEPVRLRRRELANGNISLYLDIYYNGKREYEFLKLYLIPETSRAAKEQNKQTLSLATSIKAQRIVDIQRGEHGFEQRLEKRILFIEYCQGLAKRKTEDGGVCKGVWDACIQHMQIYDPRPNITFADITPQWVRGFIEYLDTRAEAYAKRGKERQVKIKISQNTKVCYFGKLATAINKAYKDGIIKTNPMLNVEKPKPQESVRQYLTIDELRTMTATECDNVEVKRAFLFSCLTGLRRSDIEKLTWAEVSECHGHTRLTFRQKKTGGQEYLDITSQAADLMGSRGGSQQKVFGPLPFPSNTNTFLRSWALRAGVDKHITFHSARHTFAVMMLTINTDIYTVSNLLGHRDLKTTQIYAKIIDAKKQEAVDNIPKIL